MALRGRERERDPSSSFPSFIPAAQRCGFSRFYISKSKDREEEREGGHSYALETSSRTARRKHPWKDLLQMGSCREVATLRVHSPASAPSPSEKMLFPSNPSYDTQLTFVKTHWASSLRFLSPHKREIFCLEATWLC